MSHSVDVRTTTDLTMCVWLQRIVCGSGIRVLVSRLPAHLRDFDMARSQVGSVPVGQWEAEIMPRKSLCCVYLVEVVQGNKGVIMSVHVGPIHRLAVKFKGCSDDMCIFVSEPSNPKDVMREMLRLHHSRVLTHPEKLNGNRALLVPQFIGDYCADLARLAKAELKIGHVGSWYRWVKEREVKTDWDEDDDKLGRERRAVYAFVEARIDFEPTRPDDAVHRKYFAYLTFKDVRDACVRWVLCHRGIDLLDTKVVKTRAQLEGMITSAFRDLGNCEVGQLNPLDKKTGKTLRLKGFNHVAFLPYGLD